MRVGPWILSRADYFCLVEMTTHHDTIIAAWQRLLDAAPHIAGNKQL
jgi:hypothetical protein